MLIYVLPLLYELGVRAMTLTHSTRSWAGDGCEVAAPETLGTRGELGGVRKGFAAGLF